MPGSNGTTNIASYRPRRPRHDLDAIRLMHTESRHRPGYCHECFKPYPCEQAHLLRLIDRSILMTPSVRQLVEGMVRLVKSWDEDVDEEEPGLEFMDVWFETVLPLKNDIRDLALTFGLPEPWKEETWEKDPPATNSGPVSTTSSPGIVSSSTPATASSSPTPPAASAGSGSGSNASSGAPGPGSSSDPSDPASIS